MKYLQDYINNAQTACFKKHGAFFAFSQKQLAEQQRDGITYMSMGAGLIAPEENAKALVEELDTIYQKGVAQDMAENTVEGVIERELANHEYGYTGDIEPTCDALEGYGITPEQVLKVARSRRWAS